jgi:hypothetical protein
MQKLESVQNEPNEEIGQKILDQLESIIEKVEKEIETLEVYLGEKV